MQCLRRVSSILYHNQNAQFWQPRVSYIPTKKVIKQQVKQLREDKKLIKGDPENVEEILQEIEGYEAQFGHDTGEFFAQRQREDERKRRFIKKKIIEKKYFRPPQEMNLLTWDAKEQIRYLHYEFPEEWTVERLRESFPISVEGLKKLLRSKYVPRNVEELYNHDLRVKNNWLALKGGDVDPGGPLGLKYDSLIESGKVRLLENAAGNPMLPLPERKLLELWKEKEKPKKKFGRFEALIKDYAEKQKLENKALAPGKNFETDVVAQSEEIKTLLKAFVPSTASNSKGLGSHGQMFKYLRQNELSLKKEQLQVDRYESLKARLSEKGSEFGVVQGKSKVLHDIRGPRNVGRGHRSDISEQLEIFDLGDPEQDSERSYDLGDSVHQRRMGSGRSKVPKTLEEFRQAYPDEFSDTGTHVESAEHVTDDVSKSGSGTESQVGRIGRRRGRGGILKNSSDTSDNKFINDMELRYQMEGTKKLSTSPGSDTDGSESELDNVMNVSKSVSDSDSSHTDPESIEIKKQIKYATAAEGKDEGFKQAYVYDDLKGYQYPYGRVDNDLSQVNIPKDVKKPGRIFKKGNAYFDDDGEFLFRTP